MAQQIIDEINRFTGFKFDKQNNKIVNLKSNYETNIDEFLDIQYILDTNKVQHKFEQNFEIQIIK